VSSAYECLAKQVSGPHLDVFKYLWKVKAFPSVVNTAWRALTDSLTTRGGLSRRGVMMNTTLCALCQTKEESCQHIFLECQHAMSVWLMCYRWVGILFVQHEDIRTPFESFHLF